MMEHASYLSEEVGHELVVRAYGLPLDVQRVLALDEPDELRRAYLLACLDGVFFAFVCLLVFVRFGDAILHRRCGRLTLLWRRKSWRQAAVLILPQALDEPDKLRRA